MSGKDEVPQLCVDSDGSEGDGDDWEEEGAEESVFCLFCDNNATSMPVAIVHLRTAHLFRLEDLQIKFNLDQYGFIKMCNYIRKHSKQPQDIIGASEALWNDDEYLKPTDMSRIQWLTYDFEEHYNSETALKDSNQNSQVTLSRIELNDLQSRLKNLEAELKLKDELLLELQGHIQASSKKIVSELVETSDAEHKKRTCINGSSGDDPYFSSYAHYDIHHEMLSDTVRTESYQKAILDNEATFKDKIVLDLGCGSSILSMFASEAGAKKVISIDQSDIIYKAMDIVRLNGFKNIELIKGRVEETEFEPDKVDIIVSEWMGYFLLFEGMMDSVIYARDRHLKADGLLLPNRCTMSLVATGDERRHRELIQFWDNVYGYNMACMKQEVLKDATIEVCNASELLTEANVIADIDLMTATVESCNFKYNFDLRVLKEGRVTGFVGYFDTFFELPQPIMFSTSAADTPTHWKQTVFYIREPVAVKVGDSIRGTLTCQRHAKEVRSLTVKINVFDQETSYTIN